MEFYLVSDLLLQKNVVTVNSISKYQRVLDNKFALKIFTDFLFTGFFQVCSTLH